MAEELYAAIDCGTNSVRLLICRRDADRLQEVTRRLHLTRLGQGVDATGRFHPAALARTLDAMADFGAELDDLGVVHRRVVATSAARDAANSADFFTGAMERLGVAAEIIPGEEEARLSYLGAAAALPGLPAPMLVVDIGGGSTELVLGVAGRLLQAVSLNVGSVRLRERFLHSDPPPAAEVVAVQGFVDQLLDESGIDFGQVASWVGVGGTATSLSALAQRLPTYDRALVHGSVLGSAELAGLTQQLLRLPVAEVAQLPTMVPGRADVICGGALIMSAIASRVQSEALISEADILDGLVAELAGRDEG